MEIKIDRESRTPLHVQIAHQIKELILKGALAKEGRLPPSTELCRRGR